MTKLELVDVVAKKAEITKVEAKKVVDAVLVSINEGLAADGKVALPGFGTFEVAERAAREGRNPQTGSVMKIKASKAPKFSAGKALNDLVNGK